ncbi:MAG TPA: hypothetical protein VKB57_27005 [Acidimicrobiales bacterium]|nr:hypothetical protein [Acidimicrobiales bacterium]
MAESPRTIMVVKNALVKFADDQAGLALATEYQCVVTSAAITTSPNIQTVPATGCQGEAQSPGQSSFALVLSWLQDWTASGGGLSGYAWDNDTELKFFSIQPDEAATEPLAEGQVYVVAGPYLGDFGTVLVATGVTWPCFAKPTITLPA